MDELLMLLKGLDSVVAVALLLVIFGLFRLFDSLRQQLTQNTQAVVKMVALLEMLTQRDTGACRILPEDKNRGPKI